MRTPEIARDKGSRIALAMLLTAVLAVGAGPSHAASHGGRGSHRGGGHAWGGGSDRQHTRDHGHAYSGGRAGRGDSGGSARAYRGGAAYGGSGRAYSGGSGRAYNGGGSYAYGGDTRTYGGGGRIYAGGGRRYKGPSYFGGGARVLVGGGSYCYGSPVRYYSPVRVRRPQVYVGFGFGGGYSNCCYRPAYVYGVAPRPVYVEPAPVYVEPDQGVEIDVENEPPAGCYYYDPFCDQQFSNLDDYTQHLQDHHHSQTISIVEKDSGNTLRTLEFVNEAWQVRR